MLFYRSGGREFKPTRGHLLKDFGKLYTGDPDVITELASGCMDVDVQGSIL